MRKIYFKQFAVLSSALFIGTAVNAQSTSEMEFEGHNYKAFKQWQITWEEANQKAEAMGEGWHLATISSEEEQLAIQNMLSGRGGEYWLGAFQNNQLPQPEQWQWVTGEPFEYQNWAEGEPNNFWNMGEQHIGMWAFKKWKWNDEGEMRNILGYVLENDNASTLDQLTSVADIELFNFNIYPNPNQGVFTIDLNANNNDNTASVKMYNTLGELVLQKNVALENGLNTITVELIDLPTGPYWVQLASGTEILTKRMILTK